MNAHLMDAARQMPHMMGSAGGMMGNMGQMMAHPVASGAMMAAGGYAAGKGLLGAGTTLLRNPLVMLAAGVAAGYVLFKYEKEIVGTLARASGMGKDFFLNQKENLDDLIAEAQTPPPAAGQPAGVAPASGLAPASGTATTQPD